MQPRRPEWVFFNESGVPVSTFIPSAVGVVRVVGSTDEREAVRVRLRFKNGSDTETTVPLSDLNRVDCYAAYDFFGGVLILPFDTSGFCCVQIIKNRCTLAVFV